MKKVNTATTNATAVTSVVSKTDKIYRRYLRETFSKVPSAAWLLRK
jgi:hypothetical protein